MTRTSRERRRRGSGRSRGNGGRGGRRRGRNDRRRRFGREGARRSEDGARRRKPLKQDRRFWDTVRETERRYDSLTAIDPIDRFRLETEPEEMTTRIVDLLAPIGRGQRAMIVAPPKAGKTILLQKIAHALNRNHPDVVVMCLLVDERPEEVTDFRRSVPAEVFASCSDQMIEEHVATAEETFLKARRLVLGGQDVVLLMDSLTRLARAFNMYTESSGKTLTGGLDSAAMTRPRKFFGAARNVDRGGSLTVIATALIETGSRMDDIIFQEFKGTGNTEIVLSRKLAEQRFFPAIDVNQTGTRREERLLDPDELRKIRMLRRALATLSPLEAISLLIEKLKSVPTNAEFLQSIGV